MSERTTLQFRTTGDVWAIVEQWARENGYKQKESVGHEKLYQKQVLIIPLMLKIRSEGLETNLEAWIRFNLYLRMCLGFILPAETGIDSRAFWGGIAVKIARKAVNDLLARLGQPPIA